MKKIRPLIRVNFRGSQLAAAQDFFLLVFKSIDVWMTTLMNHYVVHLILIASALNTYLVYDGGKLLSSHFSLSISDDTHTRVFSYSFHIQRIHLVWMLLISSTHSQRMMITIQEKRRKKLVHTILWCAHAAKQRMLLAWRRKNTCLFSVFFVK